MMPVKSSMSNAERYSVTPTTKDLQIDLKHLNQELSKEFHSELNSERRFTKASSCLDFMIFSNGTNIAT